uniref:Apoptosis regulator BAX n=1 Tax=Aceria tosichella TaxID=561515 RepID=A0A6G1SDH3_9ACAR
MPTIATRPSLEATQAVGALLLHQFTRERFLEAGIDESLIREAEEMEQINSLASTLLEEEESLVDHNSNNNDSHVTNNETINNTTRSEIGNRSTYHQGDETITSSQHVNDTRNETGNTSFQTSANYSTVRADGGDRSGQELFHSMAADSSSTSVNGGTPQRTVDRSVYHSMNVSSPNVASGVSPSPFERLQASPCFASYGRELRRIAEEFEKSQLRENVKQQAGRVKLTDITREEFVKLLEELFQEKITREKIIILFFFCTDVALRAALSAEELVVKLLGWSFSFIINTVCSFVYKLGGWDKVLFYNFIFNQLPSLMITCCAVMAMLWFGVNIRRSLRE